MEEIEELLKVLDDKAIELADKISFPRVLMLFYVVSLGSTN